jgi:8-amino-7-oxononanoate synthase
MSSIFDKCTKWNTADDYRERGEYPYFRPIEGYDGSYVFINGNRLLMCGSNNYLGLSLDPRVKEAALKAVADFGTSCSGSRFLNGTLSLHEELEERLTVFTGKEAALCFTTGYQVNLGTISSLMGRDEYIVSDKLNHASIMDAAFFSQGMDKSIKLKRYRHNNMEDLEKTLKGIPEGSPKLIVTDGVFSMEGTVVNLPRLSELAGKYNAAVYLDEAHAFGVLGENGRGTEEHHNFAATADLVMGTFSKSFGSIGGFVAGRAKVIDYIKHFARPLIFSASMPPANLAAASKALEIITNEPERVQRLQQIAQKMIRGFTERGFNIGDTETPIVPLVTGEFEPTLKFFHRLYERGFYVNPVFPPAVPPNRCMLRTSYMATMKDEELDRFLDAARQEGKKLGIVE